MSSPLPGREIKILSISFPPNLCLRIAIRHRCTGSQGFFGNILQMEVLKFGAVNVGFKTFAPQREAGNCVYCCARCGVYSENVSQPFLSILMLGFSCFLICRSHSTSFWISFRGNYCMCSCRFGASMEGSVFRSLL